MKYNTPKKILELLSLRQSNESTIMCDFKFRLGKDYLFDLSLQQYNSIRLHFYAYFNDFVRNNIVLDNEDLKIEQVIQEANSSSILRSYLYDILYPYIVQETRIFPLLPDKDYSIINIVFDTTLNATISGKLFTVESQCVRIGKENNNIQLFLNSLESNFVLVSSEIEIVVL